MALNTVTYSICRTGIDVTSALHSGTTFSSFMASSISSTLLSNQAANSESKEEV